MAYNIGAKVTGKEWNDGHPVNPRMLLPVMTAGMACLTSNLKRQAVEIHHDLGVDQNYRAYIAGNPVQMGPGSENNIQGGPYVPAEFQRQGGQGEKGGPGTEGDSGRPPRPSNGGPPEEGGGPPGMRGASVGGSSAGMAIHKSEGLVPINDKCESNIPGLYAAGDALGSYMAGAIYTQIGSSLAGSAVQGAVAGEAAAEYAQKVSSYPRISSSRIKTVQERYLPR